MTLGLRPVMSVREVVRGRLRGFEWRQSARAEKRRLRRMDGQAKACPTTERVKVTVVAVGEYKFDGLPELLEAELTAEIQSHMQAYGVVGVAVKVTRG
jgi:hypothetical protein